MAAVEGEACEARAEAAVSEVESLVEGGSEGVSVEQDFCVEILPLIREAQNQHGLRHGDYQRYRLYCTRRMHRIRKSLHFTQGHRHKYHKKAVTMEMVTDSRLNILQFVSRHGEVVSFRFLFKAGADVAERRGYCFVEYSTREEAEKAKAALDRKVALGRKIKVDWARPDMYSLKKNAQSVSDTWDASTVSETLDSGVSTSAKIAALEAKLKQMEDPSHVATPPPHKQPHLSGHGRGSRGGSRKAVPRRVKIIHRPTRGISRTSRTPRRGSLL